VVLEAAEPEGDIRLTRLIRLLVLGGDALVVGVLLLGRTLAAVLSTETRGYSRAVVVVIGRPAPVAERLQGHRIPVRHELEFELWL
jgi:hypothetical protein